jgi:hypothetical protein
MKRRSEESILLKTLADGYTITTACQRAGVSRMFYNRHYRNDREFREKADEARTLGKQTNDDRVQSAFLKKINDGDSRLIRYYLEHNVNPYKKTRGRYQPVALPVLRDTRQKLTDAEAYEQFILWTALTPEERTWHGIETREQFCKAYSVPNVRLLDVWTRRGDFETRVSALREEWILSKTGDVLGDIYAAARGGDPRGQRLWLEYAYRVKKKRDAESPMHAVITPEDVRFAIDAMPEEMKRRNQDRLRDILTDTRVFEESLKQKERQEAKAKEDEHLAKFILPNGEIDWLAYSDTL